MWPLLYFATTSAPNRRRRRRRRRINESLGMNNDAGYDGLWLSFLFLCDDETNDDLDTPWVRMAALDRSEHRIKYFYFEPLHSTPTLVGSERCWSSSIDKSPLLIPSRSFLSRRSLACSNAGST